MIVFFTLIIFSIKTGYAITRNICISQCLGNYRFIIFLRFILQIIRFNAVFILCPIVDVAFKFIALSPGNILIAGRKRGVIFKISRPSMTA